jgi:DNA polymerase-4
MDRVGLPISVGVARTKYLAKVASAVSKPQGLLVVPIEEEMSFLHALPVERLWGVGDVTARKLHNLGITTVGQVARLEEPALIAIAGRAMGRQLHALAHNRDPRRVRPRTRRRSIGAQRAMGLRSYRTWASVDATLVALVDRVTRRMRRADRVGSTVVLRLRFGDFTRATRSHTMPYPSAETAEVLMAARLLMASAMAVIEQRGLTMVGISVTNLADGRAVQLRLRVDRHGDAELDAAVDEVRERYGSQAVIRAVLLGRDEGWSVPMLPD